jgi:hypothetical protein
MKKTKTQEYKTYVTDAYYIYSKESDALEWATEIDKTIPEFTSTHVETHDTLAEAVESMGNWGSKWVMYTSVEVHNNDGDIVYSSYPALYKCECCGHEKWDTIEDDMRNYKKQDGSVMFPEIV